MLSLLSAILVVLLFSPVFSQQVSRNDPFKVIALNSPNLDRRVCYLRVSTPPDPVDDEVLLSFEEWKKKQLEIPKELPKDSDRGGNKSSLLLTRGHIPSIGSDNATAISDTNASAGYYHSAGIQVPSEVAPHFRVPIIDRFNYANLDCSARVHGSHRSAKSPSSILSSKKDRYMLSPCNSLKEKQFVVVELCDDIRIDTVQLANFEFFSGVFKDFTVSVAKTYTTDPDGWTFAGTYRAKHVRGVQSFHPPTSLGDFYRFLRIDFLSSYGNEYYCPVSLLRVYGLTHLEEWKWDIWQAESKTKMEKSGRPVIPPVEVIHAASVQVSPAVLTTSQQSDDTEGSTSVTDGHSGTPVTTPLPNLVFTTAIPSETTLDEPDSAGIHSTSVMLLRSFSAALPSEPSASFPVDASPSADQPTLPYTTALSTTIHISVSQHANAGESILNSSSKSHTPSHGQHSDHTINSISSAPGASSPSPYPGPLIHTHPVLPPSSGESIYRTIMNRLTAVENNQTLYMKYVEQQNGAMRDVIRRLGEDLGRLEGIIRAQSVAFQRTVNDWEKQRYQLQMEYGYISRRIEVLSEEIILEKRLGVAQLCLLLAVLVFLSLTRGSRATEGITVRQHSSKGLREWGRRHLSWTGDYWGTRPKVAERRGQFDWKDKDTHQNKSDNRTGRKSVNRPSPLDLRLLGNAGTDENMQLPFPSSEPPLRQLKPMTAVTTPRRTISNPRSTNSGSATPLRSAPAPHGHGHSRRVIQKPATPTSRSQPLFKTPQVIQRSHSLSRSIVHVEMGRESLRLPTPVSQSSSWAGPSSVTLKSAKRWARTAHLHEVKKGGKKQENVNVDRSIDMEAKVVELDKLNKARDLQGRCVDTDDDFFASQPERPPLSMSTRLLNTQGPGTSSKRNPEASSSPTYRIGLETPSRLSTMHDESDPWVDTDSASVDDSGEEIFDIFSSSPTEP